MAIKIIVPKTGGDPAPFIPKLNTRPIEDNINLRDAVHALVGSGGSGLTDPRAGDNFKWIAGLKGLPFAQKLFSHISLFNQQNPNMTPQDRIQRFYTQGSKDPEIQQFVTSLAGLGGKPVLTDSHLRNNIDMGMGVADASPKVMVKVPKQ